MTRTHHSWTIGWTDDYEHPESIERAEELKRDLTALEEKYQDLYLMIG